MLKTLNVKRLFHLLYKYSSLGAKIGLYIYEIHLKTNSKLKSTQNVSVKKMLPLSTSKDIQLV